MTKKTNGLTICIAMGVLNEENRLPRCLDSLESQDFPKNRIHLMVADGGSRDNTWEIAESYGAEVFENPYVVGDLGIKLLAKKCTEDLFLPWAADNEFPRPDWLNKVVQIFEEYPDISAFWGKIVASNNDTPVNKYCALIQSEPLAWFLNKNLKKYLQQAEQKNFAGMKGYKLEIIPTSPLICGANGFVYRFEHCRDLFVNSDRIMENDVFQTMVERDQNKMIYIPEMGVYHHSIDSLLNWVSKWKRNYIRHFLPNYKGRNLNWAYGGAIRFKLILWIFYSLIPIVSGIDSLYRVVKDKNFLWFYHPAASFLQALTYIWITIFSKEGREYLMSFLKGKVK